MRVVFSDVVRGVELKPALNRAGCSCGRNNRTEPQKVCRTVLEEG